MEGGKSENDAELILKQPIIENAIYERQEVIILTGFSLSTLLRAEKAGRLQRRRVGRRRFYFGIDLLRWLGDADDSDKSDERDSNHLNSSETI